MSEYTKTIGTVTSFDGATVTIGTDCSLVTVRCPPGGVRLTRDQRDEMDRLMFTADAEAKAWSVPPGGIDCTCGHTIPEDGRCCCPTWCPTCVRIDCCAIAWSKASGEAAAHDA